MQICWRLILSAFFWECFYFAFFNEWYFYWMWFQLTYGLFFFFSSTLNMLYCLLASVVLSEKSAAFMGEFTVPNCRPVQLPTLCSMLLFLFGFEMFDSHVPRPGFIVFTLLGVHATSYSFSFQILLLLLSPLFPWPLLHVC